MRFGCLELPRQGRPLLLGEWSGSIQSDVQPIQGSLSRGNQSAPQILEVVLVQPFCATILDVHAVAYLLWWIWRVWGMMTATGAIPPDLYKS